MRENRLSGSMSGRWKRGTVRRVRHRQTKGPATDGSDLNYRATSRLYSHCGQGICGEKMFCPVLGGGSLESAKVAPFESAVDTPTIAVALD
jgi:hypothetical protein